MPRTENTKARVKKGKYRTYAGACVDSDTHTPEVLVECLVKVDVHLPSSHDKVVRPRLDVIHDLKGVRLDLVSLQDVPHVEPLRKDDHRAWNPVVIDQELPVLETVDLHPVNDQ